MKILKCNFDPLKGIEGLDERFVAIKKTLADFHLALGGGKSFVAICDRGPEHENNIRLMHSRDVEKLKEAVALIEKETPFVSVNIITIETLQ